eukprot:scaffold52958_cov13-Tisochrysis_lutea.AAC.1
MHACELGVSICLTLCCLEGKAATSACTDDSNSIVGDASKMKRDWSHQLQFLICGASDLRVTVLKKDGMHSFRDQLLHF